MRPGGRILVLAAALASLAGCEFGATEVPDWEPEVARPISQTTPPSAPPSSSSSCDTGLRFTEVSGDSAMGLRVRGIEVVNCGTQPLELNGYPQVKLLDEEWQQLDAQILDGAGGIAVVEGFDNPPQPITLQPGERAKSAFVWRNTNTSIDPPLVGRHIDIAAVPGGTWQSLVPMPPGDDFHVDLGSTGRLGVRAWYR
jgi:hypothetical protein